MPPPPISGQETCSVCTASLSSSFCASHLWLKCYRHTPRSVPPFDSLVNLRNEPLSSACDFSLAQAGSICGSPSPPQTRLTQTSTFHTHMWGDCCDMSKLGSGVPGRSSESVDPVGDGGRRVFGTFSHGRVPVFGYECDVWQSRAFASFLSNALESVPIIHLKALLTAVAASRMAFVVHWLRRADPVAAPKERSFVSAGLLEAASVLEYWVLMLQVGARLL